MLFFELSNVVSTFLSSIAALSVRKGLLARSSFLVLGNNDTDISKNQATIFMWLMPAGGFKNSPALRLYLAHGFDIIGMYGTAVMMSLCNVREESVNRSLKQLVNRLESTFPLLP